MYLGFPDRSVGKESSCNAGDLGSIPGLGRSPGEGKHCPFQYSGLENSVDCIAVHELTVLSLPISFLCKLMANPLPAFKKWLVVTSGRCVAEIVGISAPSYLDCDLC